jgi:hypothetical protein
MYYQKISQRTTEFSIAAASQIRMRREGERGNQRRAWKEKWKNFKMKIFRKKIPKINLCYPQNESNKKDLFSVHRNTFFRMTRGSLSLLSPSRNAISELSDFFFTSRDCRLHLFREKRVFIISEIEIFSFPRSRGERRRAKGKKREKRKRRTQLILDIPPVNASECAVVYACFVAACLQLMTRELMMMFKYKHRDCICVVFVTTMERSSGFWEINLCREVMRMEAEKGARCQKTAPGIFGVSQIDFDRN